MYDKDPGASDSIMELPKGLQNPLPIAYLQSLEGSQNLSLCANFSFLCCMVKGLGILGPEKDLEENQIIYFFFLPFLAGFG